MSCGATTRWSSVGPQIGSRRAGRGIVVDVTNEAVVNLGFPPGSSGACVDVSVNVGAYVSGKAPLFATDVARSELPAFVAVEEVRCAQTN